MALPTSRELSEQFDEGSLTREDLALGMHYCFLNAESLLDDAERLEQQSPGRALSLVVLAMEELGKLFLLAGPASAADRPIPWKRIKDRLKLTRHSYKQAVFRGYGRWLTVHVGKMYERELRTGTEPLMNVVKQLGLYVDCIGGEFSLPSRFGEDNRDELQALLGIARERLESIREFHSTKEASLKFAEEGAELLRIAYFTEDEEEAKQALVRYVRERNEARAPRGSPSAQI